MESEVMDAATEETKADILSELESLHSEAEEQSLILRDLGERLAPVLLPEDEGVKEKSIEDIPRSPIYIDLIRLNLHLQRNRVKIYNIMNNLNL